LLGLKNYQMGMLSSIQRHVHCFDQGFKCFARHLAWGW